MAVKPKKVAASKSVGKPKVPPKRILIVGGGAAAAIILALLIFFALPRKDAPPGAPPQATALSPGSVSERPGVSTQGLSGDDRKDFPSIRTIRLEPPRPTRMDTLKAEVLTDAPDPDRITYTYVWKVNDRIVEDADGNTLDLSALDLKKRDLISVSVTPNDGEREGFTVESPIVAVHSIPPTLDLKMPRQTRKASEPLEFQLVSLHPDSDGVTFSLEAPIIPGMSIDPNSGKITWIIQPNQEGTVRFGAVAEDTEKTKVTRIFDITVEKSFVAPVPAGVGPNSRSAPGPIVERRSSDR
ncbi:MAG: putative Ig domain-containing protein [Pseudomonadota bacterium]